MNGCSMNIGFYFFDKGLSGVDCSRPDLGNPGVGGTQYCFLLLIYYILRFDPKSYRVRVYCSSDCFFPQGVEKVLVEDIFEGLTESKRRGDDFIIIKDNKDQQLARFIDKLRHRIVIWGHNFYFGDYADWVAKSPSVIANVFVGRQQYDRYIDHPICDKSLFIYNMVPDVVGEKKRDNDGKTVVYLGALIPEKGFLVLAKMWKYILKKVPMARLQVIGGGNLYSRNCSLGRMGIADKLFEEEFFPYLSEEGELLPSVTFQGILGGEKYEVFLSSSVGVVNPSARTETFGMGAIEMNCAGLPVVTLGKNGYPDTIENGVTGYLCHSYKGIADKIVFLLTHDEVNERLGIQAKEQVSRFSPKNIMPLWFNLFEQIAQNKLIITYRRPDSHFFNNIKFVRILLRFLRKNCRLSSPLVDKNRNSDIYLFKQNNEKMKVALILATNVEKSPYMQYYIDVYKEKNIDVEVILLNRDKRVSNEEFPYKIHSCDIIARETASCVRKIYDYFRYSRFVRRILKQSDYSQIVVFTIANAVFLSYYLLSYYKKKYIFDIRDYSPLVKYTVPIIRRLLNNSALNCFSSPGFRSWLPACDYVICHNARRKSLDEDIVNARDIDVENVKVLTIGQLRNFITNKMLMDHLGNKSRITIQFSGMGIAYDLLKKYEVKKMYNNVKFTGYYPKKEEFSIVDGCDFMNIILPDDTLSRYLISNRFYLSLLRRKPMIVSSGGIQAEYVKEYDLGIIVSSEDDIYSKIMIYARSFDPIQFQKNCDRFLEMVRLDMQIFSRSVFYSLNL